MDQVQVNIIQLQCFAGYLKSLERFFIPMTAVPHFGRDKYIFSGQTAIFDRHTHFFFADGFIVGIVCCRIDVTQSVLNRPTDHWFPDKYRSKSKLRHFHAVAQRYCVLKTSILCHTVTLSFFKSFLYYITL